MLAQPTLMAAILPLASTMIPVKPITSAMLCLVASFSWKNRNPINAAHNAVMPLAMAPTPAGARSAAHANSRKGSAELIAAISAIIGQRCSENRARSRHRNGSSSNEPSARRISTSGTGPKSFTAMRVKRTSCP